MVSKRLKTGWLALVTFMGLGTLAGNAQSTFEGNLNDKIKVKEVTVPRDSVLAERQTVVRQARDYFAAAHPNGHKTLYINKNITTFIVTGDFIKLMDISVPGNMVTGNQPGDNIVRLKPVKEYDEGHDMGVVTIICERSIIQFNLVYTHNDTYVTTQYNCDDTDGVSYLNPAVDMSYQQMYKYAWAIMNSNKKFYDVSSYAQKMSIRLNNIYTTGNYFLFDFSLLNKSNIKFDIEDIRIKIVDKKKVKSTNNQELELRPTLMLNTDKSFKRDYRNVVVLPKFTFPDEKVLTITVNERQISGRTVTLEVDYAEVLNADAFHSSMMRNF